MIRYGINKFDFKKTYSSICLNSLQFENICTKESIAVGDTVSRLGIYYWDNELISIYLPSIIDNASLLDIRSEELTRKYSMNPHRLSKDYFGVTDYWYIILAMNNYTNKFDFKEFNELIFMPDVTFLNGLINNIERSRLDTIK